MQVVGLGLIALSLVSAVCSQALAYTVTRAGVEGDLLPEPLETITTQVTEDISGDTIGLSRSGSPAFAVGDIVEISLSGGTTFADSAYLLEQSLGGAGTGDTTYAVLQTSAPAGKPTIRFRMQNGGGAVSGLIGFILSGHPVLAGQPVNFNLPKVAGRDIYMTFRVYDSGGALKGSVQHLVFDNTLPVATQVRSERVIQNLLTAHARNLTAQSVGLSGLLTGRGFGNGGGSIGNLMGELAPVGNALSEAAGFSLPLAVEMSGGQGSFAASLNQIRAWDGILGVSGQDPARKPARDLTQTDSPFNLWVKGRWQGATDSRGGTDSDVDFGLIMTGADYRYSENTLIGFLAQYDLYDQSAPGQGTKGQGRGWMIGPYLVTRLHENLVWDARVAWGRSDNEITQRDIGADDFEGERWQLEANLTGDFEYQDWEIFPQLGLTYFREEQKAYTSNEGSRVGSQSVTLGSLSFGPEVSRSWAYSEDITLRPFGAFRGIWDFQSPDISREVEVTLGDGGPINTEELRARAELGLAVTFKDHGSLNAKYSYDGIGLKDYEAHSLELVASTAIDFGFLPFGSRLQSSLTQSVSESNSSRFQLSLDVPLN